ncbi:hypothetical protein AAVH_37843 [Aphelenchoides avenae]|nr:hypothetical protein AAVH_37843 [Aphelenchus avenae]
MYQASIVLACLLFFECVLIAEALPLDAAPQNSIQRLGMAQAWGGCSPFYPCSSPCRCQGSVCLCPGGK